MPVGNGDTVALVFPVARATPFTPPNATAANVSGFVVPGGSVAMFISKADAMAGDTSLLKLGLLSLALDPSPFSAGAAPRFRQTLNMSTGTVTVEAGGVAVAVWVDAASNTVHATVSSPHPVSLTVRLQSVRPPGPSSPNMYRGVSDDFAQFPQKQVHIDSRNVSTTSYPTVTAVVHPDIAVANPPPGFPTDTLVLYRRNEDDEVPAAAFNDTLASQGLARLVPWFQGRDRWRHRSSGLALGSAAATTAGQLTRINASTLMSRAPATHFHVVGSALSNQTATAAGWLQQLAAQHAVARGANVSHGGGGGHRARPDWQRQVRKLHERRWGEWAEQAFIRVGPGGNASNANATDAVTRMHLITRYVQSIQATGTPWPIKFNGQLFTANLPPAADYRDWGPNNWWQNLRLPYWNMFHVGESDGLRQLFEWWLGVTELLEARTRIYFNHSGIYTTETKTLFGTFGAADYERVRGNAPVWLEGTSFIRYDYGGNAGPGEVSLMILDHFDYFNDSAILRRFLPVVESTIDFFEQHYTNRTAEGQMVVFPTQVLETYWCDGWGYRQPANWSNCCANDLPTVASLHALTAKLLRPALEPFTTAEQRQRWRTLRAALPPLPGAVTGVLRMADHCGSNATHNSETPELYAVHPYRLYTAGRQHTAAAADLSPALGALWRYASGSSGRVGGTADSGWRQGPMNAALLGEAELAWQAVVHRATTTPAPGYRFRGFAPHMQDYTVSADHYANLNSGLQWMLLQGGEDSYSTVVLLPAWPCHLDVAFRLHAPGATLVELDYDGVGQAARSLRVTPPERAANVVFAECVAR